VHFKPQRAGGGMAVAVGVRRAGSRGMGKITRKGSGPKTRADRGQAHSSDESQPLCRGERGVQGVKHRNWCEFVEAGEGGSAGRETQGGTTDLLI